MTALVVQVIICITVILLSAPSEAAKIDQKYNQISVAKKRSITITNACTEDNEGESVYNPVYPLTIWLCKGLTWKPYELVPSAGKTKELSANNCKEIKEALSTDCTQSPESGVYWVQDQQIYCDMITDGGGWTLVWQHTYMKYNPLHPNMFYFSDFYRPCVQDAAQEDWCNVPNKTRFNPTEQMIVGYYKGTIIFAYKGYFNRNIDYHWTGAFLFDDKKVIDKCTINNGVPPAPSVHESGLFGVTFDKHSPTDYYQNCMTYERGTTLTSQTECRWHDCRLPSNISSKPIQTNMTMAIFIR